VSETTHSIVIEINRREGHPPHLRMKLQHLDETLRVSEDYGPFETLHEILGQAYQVANDFMEGCLMDVIMHDLHATARGSRLARETPVI